ncbi:MAG: hypothetical protein PHE16_08290 [Aliarcobacter sp.]|nr:hypothetical protein [Aliarcobacter sp.]
MFKSIVTLFFFVIIGVSKFCFFSSGIIICETSFISKLFVVIFSFEIIGVSKSCFISVGITIFSILFVATIFSFGIIEASLVFVLSTSISKLFSVLLSFVIIEISELCFISFGIIVSFTFF